MRYEKFDMYKFKLKDHVNLDDLVKEYARLKETEHSYEMNDDMFGEFLSISKKTKEIYVNGFTAVIEDMASKDYIEAI